MTTVFACLHVPDATLVFQWTLDKLTCEVHSLKKHVADPNSRALLRAAAASDASEVTAEPAADLVRMSRDSAFAKRAPEPASKLSRGMRSTSRGRRSARKGSVIVLRSAAQGTIPRDMLPHMDGVVRLFCSRAEAGGVDAVLKLLRVPVAELEAMDESLPPWQRFDLRDALESLVSCGSTVSWRFGGITTKTHGELWSGLQSFNCPRLSELPLWTESAFFIGDDSLIAFLAPLISDVSQSRSKDNGSQSAQALQRATSAWQQLWVNDDDDLDSGKIRVVSTASQGYKWPVLSVDSDDEIDSWTPAGRALDIRKELLSGHTSRRRKLETLMSGNRLEEATALVLTPSPASATHVESGSCLLEIRSVRGDISDKELEGYESCSDSELIDETATDNTGFCFPAHDSVRYSSSRTDSPLPPLSVFYTQTFYGDQRLEKVRNSTSHRFRLCCLEQDMEDTPSPNWFYACYPSYCIVWPAQPAGGKPSEAQQLMAQIKFLSMSVLYSRPFKRVLLDRLTDERNKLLREIAVADILRGLRLLSESCLLPLRCVRELKRHLLRCGVTAAEAQPLQASLHELDDINLVAAARYVEARLIRRMQFLRDNKAEESAVYDLLHRSSLTYLQPAGVAPELSISAAKLEAFVRDDKLDFTALSRFVFEDVAPLDRAAAAAAGTSEDEAGELLRDASITLASLVALSHTLVKTTRAVLSAKLAYDALDHSTIGDTDTKPNAFATAVVNFRAELLNLSHSVCSTHLATLTLQDEDRRDAKFKLMLARDDLQQAQQKIERELDSCVGPLHDAEISDAALAGHIEDQIEALSNGSYFESSLAHAQAAMEMLEFEIGVAHETLELAVERCCSLSLHDLDVAALFPFKRALRKRLMAEASEHAGSLLESLIAEEESRKTSEEAAKKKKTAKQKQKLEAERLKREEAAAAAAAAAAQLAAEERKAEEAAKAAEAARAAERAVQLSCAAAEHVAALERRKEEMAAAKKLEDAEKERLRARQRAERDAQLQAQEEADHARAIAASEAEFSKQQQQQQLLQSALPPAREYRPPPSSGAASILPPITAFAGMNLLSSAAEPVPAAPAMVPASIFDWPPQSLYSVLPPSSVLPPLPGSVMPPIAPLQPPVGSDISGLSNAAGEYNCFLNSLVQALYRLRCFRGHLLKSSVPERSPPQRDISRDLAVVRSLQNLFLALEGGARLLRDPLAAGGSSGNEAVAPTALRLALASLAPGGGEAAVNAMADAAEVLSSMYDCFLRVSSAFRAASDVSPVQAMFGLEMSEFVFCERCQLKTHALSFNTFFHLVHATALRHAAEQCPPSASFEQRLAFLLDEERKTCDTDFRGCGKQTPITHALGRLPLVFTISLGWDSSVASEAEVAATFKALSPSIFPQQVFRGTQQTPERELFELRAMVLYYGSHYVSVVRTSEAFKGCALVFVCLVCSQH